MSFTATNAPFTAWKTFGATRRESSGRKWHPHRCGLGSWQTACRDLSSARSVLLLGSIPQLREPVVRGSLPRTAWPAPSTWQHPFGKLPNVTGSPQDESVRLADWQPMPQNKSGQRFAASPSVRYFADAEAEAPGLGLAPVLIGFTSSSSTSKISVEFGSISRPAPRSP